MRPGTSRRASLFVHSLSRASLALTGATLLATSHLAYGAPVKSYENFDLPQNAAVGGPEVKSTSYQSKRVQFNASSRIRDPKFNAQQYLFAKEAFLTEKRDEAIKLLRQELDAGFKRNRDNLLLRLGQLYSEKYMELSYHENEYYTRQLELFEKNQANGKSATPPKSDNTRSQAYLKQALDLFLSLEKEFPRHPKIDEILFFIGFVELEHGKTEKGIRYLERVVREFPRSRKFDEALLYLGDYNFEKAKFRDALGRYRILASRKESSLYHYALYKIAWCELNTSEPKKGLRDMKALIEILGGTKEAAKFNLREQALRDLVVFYGETGDVNDALVYFTEAVGKEKALSNLRLLADLFRAKARDDEATIAYEKLIEEFPGNVETPRLYVGLAETLSRSAKTKQSVETLVSALAKFGPSSEWHKTWMEQKPSEAKESLDQLSGEALRQAYYYHSSAQKSSNRGSRQYALTLYRSLLANFPQFPDRKKVAFYIGEILFAEEKWLDAANHYMIVAKAPPKDKISSESTYNALLALDRLTAKNDSLTRFSKEQQKDVSLTPSEIPEGESKFIEVAEFYLQEYPEGSRVVDVRFRIAAIYYRFHHFDQAQASFREIALKHPKHRSAVTAANIVLDIYNLKKDYDSLNTTAGIFARTEGLGDKKFREEMAGLSGQIAFKKLEALEGQNKWSEAGEAYYAFYKANPTSELAEKALYNAQVSFEKSEDLARSAEVTRVFVAKYPTSEYTKRFMLTLAKQSEKMFDFEMSHRQYLEFYQKFPADKEARKALYNAAVFAELLEKNKVAIELYDSYLKNKETRTSGEEKSILLSLAKLYRKLGNWDKVSSIYRRLIRESKSDGEKFDLLGELARQYERGGKVSDREKMLTEIRYFYDNHKGLKSSSQASQYLAEAKFRAISPQREKYEKVQLKFPVEDLVYLLGRKQKMLAKLAASYDSVVEIGVPEWGVASFYEKGEAFDNFAQSFKKLQVPARYKGDERAELESQLKAVEAKLVTPIAVKAQEFLQGCAKRGAEFFVANEFASKCRQRLDKNSEIAPSGLMPQPSYWTTRWTGGEVAKK